MNVYRTSAIIGRPLADRLARVRFGGDWGAESGGGGQGMRMLFGWDFQPALEDKAAGFDER